MLVARSDNLLAVGIEDVVVRRKHVHNPRLLRRAESSRFVPQLDLSSDLLLGLALRARLLDEQSRLKRCSASFRIETLRLHRVGKFAINDAAEAVLPFHSLFVTFGAKDVDRRLATPALRLRET